mmetsp:Transcript_11358/g.21537  ORF Transcript_11358/g.21537 Transcript_11358/m.21537 type:complete len:425 (-) Transcript_11358:476-1750(-)
MQLWSAGALARLVAPRRHHLHPLLPVRGSQHAQRAPPPVLPGIAASRLLLLPRFPQGVGRVPHRGRALASRGGAGVKTVARGTTAGRGGRGGRRHLRGGLGRKGDGVRTRRGARAGVGGRRARTRAQVELRGHPRRGGRGGKARRQNLRPAMRRSCTSFPLARRQVGGVGGSVRQGLGPGSKTRRRSQDAAPRSQRRPPAGGGGDSGSRRALLPGSEEFDDLRTPPSSSCGRRAAQWRGAVVIGRVVIGRARRVVGRPRAHLRVVLVGAPATRGAVRGAHGLLHLLLLHHPGCFPLGPLLANVASRLVSRLRCLARRVRWDCGRGPRQTRGGLADLETKFGSAGVVRRARGSTCMAAGYGDGLASGVARRLGPSKRSRRSVRRSLFEVRRREAGGRRRRGLSSRHLGTAFGGGVELEGLLLGIR